MDPPPAVQATALTAEVFRTDRCPAPRGKPTQEGLATGSREEQSQVVMDKLQVPTGQVEQTLFLISPSLPTTTLPMYRLWEITARAQLSFKQLYDLAPTFRHLETWRLGITRDSVAGSWGAGPHMLLQT